MDSPDELAPTHPEVTEAPPMFAGASRAHHYIETIPPDPTPIAPTADEHPPGGSGSGTRSSVSLLREPFEDLGVVATTPQPQRATRGFRGLLTTLGFTVTPGRAEQQDLTLAQQLRRDEETIRQATWTRAVSVLIANQKGGAGKTPTAIITGGVLAAARGGSVCIIEVSDDPGALMFRAEGNPTRGIGELVRDITQIESAGQLAGYTAPQTSFASVIGTVGRRVRLTEQDVTAVAGVVDRYYGIRVMDSGNQPSSSAFQGAIDTADALIIPVFNAGDAVLEAVALLDVLRATGGKAADLANRAIILRLTDGRPENPNVVERLDRIITEAQVSEVFEIPYDAHIAERGQITLAHLAAPTYRAFAAATAAVVRSLQNSVR